MFACRLEITSVYIGTLKATDMKQNTNSNSLNLIKVNNQFKRVDYVAASSAHDVNQKPQGKKLITENGVSVLITWFSLS